MDSTRDFVDSATQRASRFVVLRHTDRHGVHYDLMIDLGERLATWKCLGPPEESGTSGQSCTRIADHRLRYLDYEGPISGERGRVARHDHGLCDLLVRQEDNWNMDFHGERLKGPYILKSQKVEKSKSQNHRTADGGRAEPQSWLLRAQ